MPIISGHTNLIKQVAADAIAPAGSILKCVLIKPGAAGMYDRNYSAAYALGMGGDEVPNGNGYTQGGITLTGRTSGPTDPLGWVDYTDPVWNAVGALSAIGAAVVDTTLGNRFIGFIDFGGTLTATNAPFTVQLPADGGSGMVRVD